jgi:F-box/leucine-rich repeat protein 10/11
LSGAKTFFFVPPTPTNLKKYERWCTSPEQASTFFAEQVHPCYRVDLKAGDTM